MTLKRTAEETDHSDLRLEASKNALLLRRLKFDCQRIKQNKIRVEWYLPFSFNKLIRVNIPLQKKSSPQLPGN